MCDLLAKELLFLSWKSVMYFSWAILCCYLKPLLTSVSRPTSKSIKNREVINAVDSDSLMMMMMMMIEGGRELQIHCTRYEMASVGRRTKLYLFLGDTKPPKYVCAYVQYIQATCAQKNSEIVSRI